jgi:hypothetical protein
VKLSAKSHLGMGVAIADLSHPPGHLG